jgi:hypothetical protein
MSVCRDEPEGHGKHFPLSVEWIFGYPMKSPVYQLKIFDIKLLQIHLK